MPTTAAATTKRMGDMSVTSESTQTGAKMITRHFQSTMALFQSFTSALTMSTTTHARMPAKAFCTTGYSDEQLAEIDAASKHVPLFKSGNMSLGVNLMIRLAKRAAAVLGGSFDVEILERHHNRKLDAPSGTALMLADAAASALPYEAENVFERHSVRQPRRREEIGISSIRGGTIVGEHEVIFAGHDEVFEMKHTALSREVFASGAIAAAKFIATVKTPGMYDMDDLLRDVMK